MCYKVALHTPLCVVHVNECGDLQTSQDVKSCTCMGCRIAPLKCLFIENTYVVTNLTNTILLNMHECVTCGCITYVRTYKYV